MILFRCVVCVFYSSVVLFFTTVLAISEPVYHYETFRYHDKSVCDLQAAADRSPFVVDEDGHLLRLDLNKSTMTGNCGSGVMVNGKMFIEGAWFTLAYVNTGMLLSDFDEEKYLIVGRSETGEMVKFIEPWQSSLVKAIVDENKPRILIKAGEFGDLEHMNIQGATTSGWVAAREAQMALRVAEIEGVYLDEQAKREKELDEWYAAYLCVYGWRMFCLSGGYNRSVPSVGSASPTPDADPRWLSDVSDDRYSGWGALGGTTGGTIGGTTGGTTSSSSSSSTSTTTNVNTGTGTTTTSTTTTTTTIGGGGTTNISTINNSTTNNNSNTSTTNNNTTNNITNNYGTGTGDGTGGTGDGTGDGLPDDYCTTHPEDERCKPVTDPGMPGGAGTSWTKRLIPTDDQDWYTRRFPGGLAAVWTSQRAELMASPLVTFAGGFRLPTAGGSFPRWTVDLVGIGGGSYVLAIPDTVTSVMRVLMILVALIAARRIVFGG